MKKHVINYWELFLRAEAAALDSLSFFNAKFCSLSSPHPMWSMAGSSPAKVAMCTIQGQMVSGRFRTEELCSNWSSNKAGICLLSPECSSTPEDILHILHQCPALETTRNMLREVLWKTCNHQRLGIRSFFHKFSKNFLPGVAWLLFHPISDLCGPDWWGSCPSPSLPCH